MNYEYYCNQLLNTEILDTQIQAWKKTHNRDYLILENLQKGDYINDWRKHKNTIIARTQQFCEALNKIGQIPILLYKNNLQSPL